MFNLTHTLDTAIFATALLVLLVSTITLGSHFGQILKHTYLHIYLTRVGKDSSIRMSLALAKQDNRTAQSLSQLINTIQTLSTGSNTVLTRAYMRAARESFLTTFSLFILILFL